MRSVEDHSSSSITAAPPPKRLIFDRRYGWVLDEWRDPSEEALSGSRGMFCIMPLGKALLQTALQSINAVANSTLKVLERPDMLSPDVMQATLSHQVHKIASSIKKPEFDMNMLRRNFLLKPDSCSSDVSGESNA